MLAVLASPENGCGCGCAQLAAEGCSVQLGEAAERRVHGLGQGWTAGHRTGLASGEAGHRQARRGGSSGRTRPWPLPWRLLPYRVLYRITAAG
jgi:hypothetical protein